MDRRSFIAGAAALAGNACVPMHESTDGRLVAKLRIIERALGGRLGVAFHDPVQRASLAFRGEERFPMCSTFKTSLAALALEREQTGKFDLSQRVMWAEDDLLHHCPFTGPRVASGATLRELARAAQTVSDNLAANILLGKLGGPATLTQFWRSLGDDTSRLDRMETELNYVPEGDIRDTTSPSAMARTLGVLLASEHQWPLVPERQRELRQWMLETTTGLDRVRAGVPNSWRVGDKTGNSGAPPGMGYLRGDIGFVMGPGDVPTFFAAYHQSPVDAPIEGEKVDIAFQQIGEILTGWTQRLYTIVVT